VRTRKEEEGMEKKRRDKERITVGRREWIEMKE